MEQSLDLLNNDIQLNASAENILLDTARWGKFLSIIGFILCALMIAIAFFVGYFISHLDNYRYSYPTSNVGPAVTAVYIILAILLFFPCLFLFRFSTKMQAAFKTLSQEQFESSIQNLKSMFKFLGIITIIILSIWILSFLIIAITGAK